MRLELRVAKKLQYESIAICGVIGRSTLIVNRTVLLEQGTMQMGRGSEAHDGEPRQRSTL
jgi:hypothetical protein